MQIFVVYQNTLQYTAEPLSNDIGFLRHLVYNFRYPVAPINPSLLTIILYSSVITVPVYNDTK